MLMMFADDIAKIPLEKTCPLDANNLLVIFSPDIAISLTNIQDDRENFFSIKSIMESGDVFACKNFEQACEDFSKILDTRLERFYETFKTKYIFFDEEEQMYIRDILVKNRLNCMVQIYLKKDGKFDCVDFEDISITDYNKVKKYIRQYNVRYVIRPDRYIELRIRRNKKASDFKNRFEAKKDAIEKQQIKKYFVKYPELEKMTNKESVTKLYKELAMKYHPDRNPEDPKKFSEINVDFETIRETSWFKSLGKKKHKTTEAQKSIFDKKKEGFVFKLFKAMTIDE